MSKLIKRLTDAQPPHLSDAGMDPNRRRAELGRAFASAATASAPALAGRRGRRRWVLGGLAPIATAVAVGIAVLATTSPQDGAGGTGGGHPAQATPLSARQVLLAAASTAARQPGTTTGRYWHTVSHRRGYYPIQSPTGSYTIVDLVRDERWIPAAGGLSGAAIYQDLGFHPVGSADVAAWRRAGSPRTLRAGGESLSVKPGPALTNLPMTLAGQIPVSLPSDPARLKTVLLGTNVNVGQSNYDRLFNITFALFQGAPQPAGVRAAAFKMLADLPGITRAGTVDDGEGHAGTAVGIVNKGPGKSGRGYGSGTERIIFDPSTSDVLGYSDVVIVPMAPGEHPGDPVGITTVVSQGWTNSRP